MAKADSDGPKIYLAKIGEAINRLDVSERYLSVYNETCNLFELESAALQLRKAMEAIAFAAIAPNKEQYAAFRKNAERSPDFREDYQADTIFLSLQRINPDFYPVALSEPILVGARHWHFERSSEEVMTRKSFEKLYKRLGKFLHADNPWGDEKGWNNFSKDLPGAIKKIRELLKKHHTLLRVREYAVAWVVDAPSDGTPPRMFQGAAEGEVIAASPGKRK